MRSHPTSYGPANITIPPTPLQQYHGSFNNNPYATPAVTTPFQPWMSMSPAVSKHQHKLLSSTKKAENLAKRATVVKDAADRKVRAADADRALREKIVQRDAEEREAAREREAAARRRTEIFHQGINASLASAQANETAADKMNESAQQILEMEYQEYDREEEQLVKLQHAILFQFYGTTIEAKVNVVNESLIEYDTGRGLNLVYMAIDPSIDVDQLLSARKTYYVNMFPDKAKPVSISEKDKVENGYQLVHLTKDLIDVVNSDGFVFEVTFTHESGNTINRRLMVDTLDHKLNPDGCFIKVKNVADLFLFLGEDGKTKAESHPIESKKSAWYWPCNSSYAEVYPYDIKPIGLIDLNDAVLQTSEYSASKMFFPRGVKLHHATEFTADQAPTVQINPQNLFGRLPAEVQYVDQQQPFEQDVLVEQELVQEDSEAVASEVQESEYEESEDEHSGDEQKADNENAIADNMGEVDTAATAVDSLAHGRLRRNVKKVNYNENRKRP